MLVPSKIRKDDWERLFGPNAPRRGGPLQGLGNVLIVLIMLGVFFAGTQFLLRYRDQQQATARANATLIAATAYPRATQTAAAATATNQAVIAARTAAAQPTAVAGIGTGTVQQGGNLRREPAIDPTNIVGLIYPGDEITFLEQRDVSGQTWYRVQLLKPAANRPGPGVEAGGQGWASSLLLSQPQ